ncbi:uncharacterized protein LOC125031910 isoform X2 [Penaeus chinensis]|uniref:uncharacterized protein LOC125031910 isoform X2 n=1 Tax=Penaeus chinensis TaxID=139456 RepID=UPI001FB8504B|nr:uncharacterized protein LOC125031910 isoform X2 [Penaeus chinensis]
MTLSGLTNPNVSVVLSSVSSLSVWNEILYGVVLLVVAGLILAIVLPALPGGVFGRGFGSSAMQQLQPLMTHLAARVEAALEKWDHPQPDVGGHPHVE